MSGSRLRFSERALLAERELTGDQAVVDVLERLGRERARRERAEDALAEVANQAETLSAAVRSAEWGLAEAT